MRLPLDIAPDPRRLKEWMAIMVQVTKLAGNVIRHLLPDIDARGKAVADACLSRSSGRIDRPVAVETIPDIGADFVLLCEGGESENKPHQALHSNSRFSE